MQSCCCCYLIPIKTKMERIIKLVLLLCLVAGREGLIGVNYGRVADNLPPAAQVARFLANSTTINRVRLFDSDRATVTAFSHTGIAVTVTVPTDEIPGLTKPYLAQEWVRTNILPHAHSTNIVRVLVGNEVLSTGNRLLITTLVPAMQALHAALVEESLHDRIKISTPHSLGILSNSSPPSAGRFRQGYDVYVIRPLLSFLRMTDSPFMINPYPFFGATEATLDYALFRANEGVVDGETGLVYGNMVDAQLDAVFSALRRMGFDDVDVVIAETGWPSRGEAGQLGADAGTAAEYNRMVMRHVASGVGTPLMPNRTFETYIFALFDEDLKPGPVCERSFGLFRPDLTPAYDIGILKAAANGGGGVRVGRSGLGLRPGSRHECGLITTCPITLMWIQLQLFQVMGIACMRGIDTVGLLIIYGKKVKVSMETG
ncbi:glucan endo-1,3-beta-glucosidase-like isoform X2 [Salvia splendens]|uniref:glucan endo-1,3-beta-glucosidase-like isoform X2 n=1 Tax=Salvia splendens TaxID=180675 RepID=UPI001C253CB0|nr:glucan endo-1,3-beta-glucosidase-like isoform X2 [Salvia splendens]